MHNRSNKAIEDLCTSYSAYVAAIRENNDQAIAAWAICLISDQTETGVEMVPTERLRATLAIRQSIVKEMY